MIWNDILKEYFANQGKQLLHKLKSFKEQKIVPDSDCVFNAYSEKNCPFENVKVVMLYNEPTPDSRIADGLAFSSKIESHVQKSLKGFYNILYSTFYGYMSVDRFKENFSGSLLNWANQGVILANIRLTVQEGIPMSHAGIGWEEFTNTMITLISRLKKADNKKVLFVFVGEEAHAYSEFVDSSFHTIVNVQDPSDRKIESLDNKTKDLFRGIHTFTYMYYPDNYKHDELYLHEALNAEIVDKLWDKLMCKKGYPLFGDKNVVSNMIGGALQLPVDFSVGFDFRTNIKN